MKKIFTLLLAGVSALASAQNKIDLTRSIDDNGRNLTIRVKGTVNGKTIGYERTFDVAGLTKTEKTEIGERVFDSLGIDIEAPAAPRAPKAPRPVAVPSTSGHVYAGASSDLSSVMISEDRPVKNIFEATMPFSKEVKFNDETGELFLRYEFMKDGEEYIYEKTVDAQSKSARQRESIIKSFEKEIGLPGK